MNLCADHLKRNSHEKPAKQSKTMPAFIFLKIFFVWIRTEIDHTHTWTKTRTFFEYPSVFPSVCVCKKWKKRALCNHSNHFILYSYNFPLSILFEVPFEYIGWILWVGGFVCSYAFVSVYVCVWVKSFWIKDPFSLSLILFLFFYPSGAHLHIWFASVFSLSFSAFILSPKLFCWEHFFKCMCLRACVYVCAYVHWPSNNTRQ